MDNTLKATQLLIVNSIISRIESYAMVKKVIASILMISALTLHEISLPFAVGLLVPIIYLWIMDAYYLRLGRLFRKHQDNIANNIMGNETAIGATHDHSILRTALTPTISLYYISLLILVGSVLCPA